MTIKVKTTDTGEAYFDIKDFASIVDISKVEYYTFEEIDDDGHKSLLLKFFDKDQNPLDVNYDT